MRAERPLRNPSRRPGGLPACHLLPEHLNRAQVRELPPQTLVVFLGRSQPNSVVCRPIALVGLRPYDVSDRRRVLWDKKPRMNPLHRDADRSAGLHLFQELSTLGQQLAHTLLFRQGCGQRARRDRSSPSAVCGPVLAPPCIRHLLVHCGGQILTRRTWYLSSKTPDGGKTSIWG